MPMKKEDALKDADAVFWASRCLYLRLLSTSNVGRVGERTARQPGRQHVNSMLGKDR